MKKNAPYLILFGLLIMVAGFLYWQNLPKSEPDKDFSIKNVEEIAKLRIEDKKGLNILLEKRDGIWYIGKYKAQKSLILPLLETVNKWRVAQPISPENRKKAIEDIRKYGIKLRFENEKSEEIKTIHIGSMFKDIGNYMILEKDGQVMPNPYLVKFPAFKGNLTYRFLADSVQWRSTVAFQTRLDYIEQIKVTYHEQPNLSFTLTKDEKLIKIDPIADSLKINKGLNKEKVVNFLLPFEELHFERYILVDSIINFIKSQKPYISVSLKEIDGATQELILYRIPVDLSNPYLDVQGNIIPVNIERFYGYIPKTKTYCTVQYYNFGPILRDYEYFF